MPTFLGEASIASGYTPSALAGALPRHPPAPKGVKKCNSEKGTLRKICVAETKKRPVAKKPADCTSVFKEKDRWLNRKKMCLN